MSLLLPTTVLAQQINPPAMRTPPAIKQTKQKKEQVKGTQGKDNPRIPQKVVQRVDGWMPDKALQIMVSTTLNIPVSALTQGEMLRLTYLNIPEGSETVSSLRGLEYAENLDTLIVAASEIADIQPLSELKKLETVFIMQSKLADLSPLKNHTAIKELHLDGSPITDYSAISSLVNLEIFGSRTSNIADVSFLEPLEQLQSIQLWGNQIKNIDALAKKQTLDLVELSYNPLEKEAMNVLSSLDNLSKLYLDGTELTTVDALKSLNKLTSLFIFGNHLTDLSPLKHLENLETVSASGQTVTLAEVAPQGDRYLQKTPIRLIDNTEVVITPNNEGAEQGVSQGNDIDWQGLSDKGELRATWSTITMVPKIDFAGELILPYQKRASQIITVKYLDVNDQSISQDQEISGFVGENYDATTAVYKLNIEGYRLDELNLPTNATGQFSDQSEIIRYYYQKEVVDAADVLAHYRDETGKELFPSKSISGSIGQSYDATTSEYQPTITGYLLDQTQLPDNGKGQFSDRIQQVTYVYLKLTDEQEKPEKEKPTTPEKNQENKPSTESEKQQLPQTGEQKTNSLWLLSGGIISLASLYYLSKKKNQE